MPSCVHFHFLLHYVIRIHPRYTDSQTDGRHTRSKAYVELTKQHSSRDTHRHSQWCEVLYHTVCLSVCRARQLTQGSHSQLSVTNNRDTQTHD